jgi:hypothetical protein
MVIDTKAPVYVRRVVEIQATIELVWETMTEFTRWPEWNGEVKSVTATGPVEPGTDFTWKVRGGTITSRLQEVQRPARLVWTGRLRPMGIEAVHAWKLEPHDGHTMVETEETWSGTMVKFLSAPARRMLARSVESGLAGLKRRCEIRAAGDVERSPVSDD